ncbi:MAG TPA: FAD-dependent oxidoreductase, partial [Clostridiales bacterium]|nr:FAD-dependent oxidoreductase [Clostridiales bacterium]
MQKNVPVTEEVDVVVVGGGIAGISAALAAAFMGSKVLLVEHFAVFGGNATSGGVASFCGNTKGQGKAFDMIVAALKEFNAIV